MPGYDWAGGGQAWASRFVKICRVPGEVVSESVRASQEEIWPLKGGGWVDGEFVRVAREGERAGRARHYCGSAWKVGRMIMDGRGMTTRCRERLERVY